MFLWCFTCSVSLMNSFCINEDAQIYRRVSKKMHFESIHVSELGHRTVNQATLYQKLYFVRHGSQALCIIIFAMLYETFYLRRKTTQLRHIAAAKLVSAA
ncbi:hypothetical protein KP509_14G037400 [Ceratopteris richardii]|uniref:Uncharacterized protein n=1 Tax=Ceratopteris richardii TaxID=49495 RepID=A0A8T2T911_CERRI|nr:hypothetical protein KP509_14G037400 [Ceratopteris richardii]